MSIKLSTAYLEKNGIRAPNYFNGRLLSAEDMTAEQAALRQTLAQLGRATGDGIAYGLLVTGPIGGDTVQNPMVTVGAGLAISRNGTVVELMQSVDVSLRQPDAPGSPAPKSAGGFAACTALPTSAFPDSSGKGVYLLTIRSAEGREGRAPASGLGNIKACCDDKSIVEGVTFRLILLQIPSENLDDLKLRNRLAHDCFGSADPALAGFAANPFGAPPAGYGLVDKLRDGRLDDDEVPLALIFWSDTGGTRFIDLWSVRRRVIRPASPNRWLQGLGDRRAAEKEAMFYQFQEQAETWATPSPEVIRALDYFDYLPPAGVLPIGGSPARDGFVDSTFFNGLTTRSKPLYIEGSRLAAILAMSLYFPPIKLDEGLLIWTYVVRENQQLTGGTASAAPILVFTTGHMPNFGDPRFDVSRWKYANYYLNAGTLG